MKWKCTYVPEEQREVDADLAALRLRHPAGKIHAGTVVTDQRQVYLKVRPGAGRQLTPCDFCRHTQPSDDAVKPCSVCPAEACEMPGSVV